MSTTYDERMNGVADMVEAIQFGRFDTDLDRIREALKERQDTLTESWRAAIRPGFRVITSINIRPAYMAGVTGTVTEHKNGRWTVECDWKVGSNRYGSHSYKFIRVHASSLYPEQADD